MFLIKNKLLYILVTVLFSIIGSAQTFADEQKSVLGYTGHSIPISSMTSWMQIQEKYSNEETQWFDILQESGRFTDDKFRQLEVINFLINLYVYKSDIDGEWKTPNDFLAHGGDCEDYSIAKYFALIELGWDEKDLELVLVFDIERGMYHAVLAVTLGSSTIILDNASQFIGVEQRFSKYIPVLGMTKTEAWHYASITHGKMK